ncbi:MAG: ABC transporter permease [Hymenobacteraceae bacterium]|nr:ABC transporter permease [Hymenobacteraceae bacterium]
MFRNYLKTALRSLWKNRTYSFLNVGGLAIGIACAALIFLWVQDEVTFDRHHAKRKNLYLVMNNQTYDGTTYTFSSTPGPLGPALKAEVPGVVHTTRTAWGQTNLFTLQDKTIFEFGNYVDADFLQMFTFEFVSGKPADAFREVHTVVISERMAHKFFGDGGDPIGKTLKMNNTQEFTVTGVFKNQPLNSSFCYEWLAPFEVLSKSRAFLQHWSSNGIQTYVELAPNANLTSVGQSVHGFIRSKEVDAVSTSILFPMSDWHLYSKFKEGKQDGGRIEYVRLFTVVACFILLIACINFMNLATARSEKRAREVGMRKVLGSTKNMLIGQFIGESLVLSLLSVLMAVVLTFLALPAFNRLVEKELALDLLSPPHVLGLVSIGVLTGLLAGSYPAFYLSSFAPVAVLKGLRIQPDSGAGLIRKGLVVFQFTVSIVLIIGTTIVYQQIQHVKTRELGYDKSHLIYLMLDDQSKDHFSAIRNALRTSGAVDNAALSYSNIMSLYSNAGGFNWEGKDAGKDILITQDYVSPEYLSTIGLKLIAGRDFRPNADADSNNVIINETLARLLHKQTTADVVGSLLTREGGEHLVIIGVIKDFLFSDFYKKPEPLILYPQAGGPDMLTIRLKAGQDVQASLAKIGAVMKTANLGYPFEYKFMEEEFDRKFNAEDLIGKLAGVFAGLAILISCLGLFGLAAYTAERRTREIGIRKVLGASMQTIVGLLSKDFLVLVGISCLIAFPLAWWALNTWLNGYAYRTPISWWVFGVAGGAALLIALFTVSFQAIKAALANPVNSLRAE